MNAKSVFKAILMNFEGNPYIFAKFNNKGVFIVYVLKVFVENINLINELRNVMIFVSVCEENALVSGEV